MHVESSNRSVALVDVENGKPVVKIVNPAWSTWPSAIMLVLAPILAYVMHALLNGSQTLLLDCIWCRPVPSCSVDFTKINHH